MLAPPHANARPAFTLFTRSSGSRFDASRGRFSVLYCTRNTLPMLLASVLVSSETREFVRFLKASTLESPPVVVAPNVSLELSYVE